MAKPAKRRQSKKSKVARKPAAAAGAKRTAIVDPLSVSDEVMKRVLKSQQSSIDFLIEAGILDPDGIRLAKPYR